MNILLLSNRPTANTQAETVTEYLDSFSKYSEHNIYEISMLHHFPEHIDLNRFDAVITHYSLSIGPMLYHYLGSNLVDQLKRFKGLKAAFLQDEYREIKTYWKHINELGINVLFSCVPTAEVSKVYPQTEVPNLQVVNVLTGYVPEALLQENVMPIYQRSIDVGYRTRKMWYWLGALAHEKWFISEEFERLVAVNNLDLKLDLSNREGDRLYGKAWTKFVASCKTVLGVESGASIIDFDGLLERRVDQYTSKNPGASFEEVSELFLRPYEGSLRLHQISPRCFEAAALRTPMVLFEGSYSGILYPERHYIPLRKDFSNFNEVVKRIKDSDYLQDLAERTYQEIALNPLWSYRSFVNIVDESMKQGVRRHNTMAPLNPYTKSEFDWHLKKSIRFNMRRQLALKTQAVFLGRPFFRKALFGIWHSLPYSVQKIIRPLTKIISR